MHNKWFLDYRPLCNFCLTCHFLNIYNGVERERTRDVERLFNSIIFSRPWKLIFIFHPHARTGICTTTDVDPLLSHMNNARYLRELDFARADFYERTNLYREICSQGSGVVQGAATIRYRRFLKPFTIFKITSKVFTSDHVKSYYGLTFRSLYFDRSSIGNPYKKFSRFFSEKEESRPFVPDNCRKTDNNGINLLTLFVLAHVLIS